MIPLHFGVGDAPLYGVYHPASEPRKKRGALLLNPWGWEALRAHRTLKTLADRLASAGYDTLRFDYSCSGDSAGSHAGASLSAWLDDAELALREIMSLSAVRRVSVYGLRLGGLLAGLLSERCPREVDRVVLWEAPMSGQEFLHEMESAPTAEVSAFPITQDFRREIEPVDLAHHLRNFRGHIVTITPREVALNETRARSLERIMPSYGTSPPWVEDRTYGAGVVPVKLIDRLIATVQ